MLALMPKADKESLWKPKNLVKGGIKSKQVKNTSVIAIISGTKLFLYFNVVKTE